MKTVIVLSLVLFPASVFAQNTGNMQNMMQVMQEVQQCMAKIDQAQLNGLQMRSQKVTAEIDTLCTEGKRDEAQKRAMKFGREMAADPVMKQMQTCGEIAQGALPMMDMVQTYDEKEYKDRHVCDD